MLTQMAYVLNINGIYVFLYVSVYGPNMEYNIHIYGVFYICRMYKLIHIYMECTKLEVILNHTMDTLSNGP